MLTALTTMSDRLLSAIVPEIEAAASADVCVEIATWCDGDCPFWWWRRAHQYVCEPGVVHTEFECCGCGC